MDALAISVLAIRLFVEKAPPEVVREHQEQVALGTSTFDRDVREGLATARARTQRFWPRRQVTS
jgi:hypothetical protein